MQELPLSIGYLASGLLCLKPQGQRGWQDTVGLLHPLTTPYCPESQQFVLSVAPGSFYLLPLCPCDPLRSTDGGVKADGT